MREALANGLLGLLVRVEAFALHQLGLLLRERPTHQAIGLAN